MLSCEGKSLTIFIHLPPIRVPLHVSGTGSGRLLHVPNSPVERALTLFLFSGQVPEFRDLTQVIWASLVAQKVKYPPTRRKSQV